MTRMNLNEPRNERLNECCAAAESAPCTVPKVTNSPKIPHEFKEHLTDLTRFNKSIFNFKFNSS